MSVHAANLLLLNCEANTVCKNAAVLCVLGLRLLAVFCGTVCLCSCHAVVKPAVCGSQCTSFLTFTFFYSTKRRTQVTEDVATYFLTWNCISATGSSFLRKASVLYFLSCKIASLLSTLSKESGLHSVHRTSFPCCFSRTLYSVMNPRF